MVSISSPSSNDTSPAPTTPDWVRTDTLQPGDQIRHPHDWTLFTVSAAAEQLDDLGSSLDFHNRETAKFERGMRVTGTDASGETVYVDTAPSYLWHREGQQPSTRAHDALAEQVAEVSHLRARVAELEAQRDRRRGRVVALQNDALNMRGSLSPNGEARKVPFELGETLAPAVDWLIARVAELETQAETVAAFCGKRAEYVTNLRNCNPNADHDYFRWTGHAAARRQLSQLLGLPVAWPAEDAQDSHEAAVAAYLSTPYTDDTTPVEDPHDSPRPRRVTPMQVLAHDVETAIAPLTGDAKAGAEMVLRYIRTLAAEATIPFTTEATS